MKAVFYDSPLRTTPGLTPPPALQSIGEHPYHTQESPRSTTGAGEEPGRQVATHPLACSPSRRSEVIGAGALLYTILVEADTC